MEFKSYAITPTIHREAYPAISPSRPELSQAGKTVLITGGNSGIGYGIARGFVRAQAAKVIITGRRPESLAQAVEDLQQEAIRSHEAGDNSLPKTEVIGLRSDVADSAAVNALWDGFVNNGIAIDVLVLNAVTGGLAKPVLENETIDVWRLFDMNVRAQLHMTKKFHEQPKSGGASKTKYLVYISSAAIHDPQIAALYPTYSLTKHTCQSILQMVAGDTQAEDMQIVSFHPGAILSESAKSAGMTEDTLAWDDVDLPGHFAVWAATPESRFLHERFVWAAWDVEELQEDEVRKRIDEDKTFLKIGVHGL
ncbi:short-chain dehydrogenase [Xylariaceae sp. FL0255]|nr:short-chain dehydrogenase [Xylariaceae sp. FL0255]